MFVFVLVFKSYYEYFCKRWLVPLSSRLCVYNASDIVIKIVSAKQLQNRQHALENIKANATNNRPSLDKKTAVTTKNLGKLVRVNWENYCNIMGTLHFVGAVVRGML